MEKLNLEIYYSILEKSLFEKAAASLSGFYCGLTAMEKLNLEIYYSILEKSLF